MKALTTISFVFVLLLFSCKTQVKKRYAERMDTLAKKKTVWADIDKEKQVGSIKDTVALLRQFFAPDTIINKVALWKPDFEAKLYMNVSYDGYCHTCIDTIIKIDSSDNNTEGYDYHLPGYVIVFATKHYYDSKNGEKGECQLCGANYGCAYIIGDKVEGFKRNMMTSGSDADMADSISLRKMGQGSSVLDISTGYTGSELIEYENLFSFPDFTEILSLQAYNSNEGSWGSSDIEFLDITEKNLSNLPNKADKYHDDINVQVLHTHYSNKKHTQVTDESKEHYRWDDENNIYVRK